MGHFLSEFLHFLVQAVNNSIRRGFLRQVDNSSSLHGSLRRRLGRFAGSGFPLGLGDVNCGWFSRFVHRPTSHSANRSITLSIVPIPDISTPLRSLTIM